MYNISSMYNVSNVPVDDVYKANVVLSRQFVSCEYVNEGVTVRLPRVMDVSCPPTHYEIGAYPDVFHAVMYLLMPCVEGCEVSITQDESCAWDNEVETLLDVMYRTGDADWYTINGEHRGVQLV